MLRRLLPYARGSWQDLACGATLLLLCAGLELLQPWPVKWLVDYVFTSHPPPLWLARLWPAFASHHIHRSVTGICILIVAPAVGYKISHVLSQKSLIRAGARIAFQFRSHLADHLNRLSLDYHDRSKVGDSLYRAAYDTLAAQSLLSGAVVPIGTGVLILTGILLVMFRMDAMLTYVAITMLPAFWLTIHGFGRVIERRSSQYHQKESLLVSDLQETLSSIRAVQAFTQEEAINLRYRRVSDASLAANQRLVSAQLNFGGVVGIIMAFGTAIVVGVGAERVIAGRLLPGDVLVFLAYLGMLYQPMNAFSQSAGVAQSARAQLERAFHVLDQQPKVKDKMDARPLPHVEGGIEFHHVSFAYDADQPVLQNICISIAARQVVALVGSTGSGKSTLASLMLRFYDPTSGAIFLDGTDLRDLPLAWLRRHISIVMQDAFLFSGTIRENIAYGKPTASLSEVQRAAQRAQIDDFIQSLPEGYDTLLGERGVNLSGGQRQRLSIARAFLKNAPILILDEPTSALDAHTEERLMAALRELMQDRTTIIIAHRFSTIRYADTLLVMQEGKIVEAGTHEQLFCEETLYRSLFARHLENEDPLTRVMTPS